jgi:hypothetical protein
MISRSEITIVFEDPFWVAIFEQYRNGYYSVAREVIGTSEPQGSELVLFFRKLDYENLKFTQPVKEETIDNKKINFKRQMRNIRLAQHSGLKHTYTKAHAIIKANQSALKEEKRKQSRWEREEEKREKFRMNQQKKKEKQKGH